MKYRSPRFTDYTNLAAYLGSLPAGQNPVHPLYPIGGGGNDSSRIGHWGRNAAGVIVPFGAIQLDRVTTSQYGTAASAAGVAVELVSAAAWTPASGTLRAWDSTGELGDSAYTRSGTTLTVTGAVATAVAAAITAGRTVTLWDTATELSVGGSTREFRILGGTPPIFSGYLHTQNAAVGVAAALDPHKWRLRAAISLVDGSPADGSILGFGAWWSAVKCCGGGRARLAGAYKFSTFTGSATAVTVTGAAEAPAGGAEWIVERQYVQPFGEYTALTEYQATGKGASTSHGANNASPVSALIVAKPAAAEVVAIRIATLRVE